MEGKRVTANQDDDGSANVLKGKNGLMSSTMALLMSVRHVDTLLIVFLRRKAMRNGRTLWPLRRTSTNRANLRFF